MPRIPYVADSFPAGTVANGSHELNFTWGDLLWAALTVGRPNRQYVFRHGLASTYEALFRLSMVRMALEQSGPGAFRLRRTSAAKTLDPTEKGAVNYFIGMAVCKLFASKLLGTHWVLHLDVFRPLLNPVLSGRSRPDLVGNEAGTTKWHAFECKGRISAPNTKAKTSAKAQAQRLVSVNGVPCTLHVGAITHLRGEVLHFYWRDPQPDSREGIDVPYSPTALQHHYGSTVELLEAMSPRAWMQPGQESVAVVEACDARVGVHPIVARLLGEKRWGDAQHAALENAETLASAGYQPDGLKVEPGPSWSGRFDEGDVAEEDEG